MRADPKTVIGQLLSSDGTVPVKWDVETGTLTQLLPLRGVDYNVSSASSDGSVIAGFISYDENISNKAYVWRSKTNSVDVLQDFSGGLDSAKAWNISADGRVITGYGFSDQGRRAAMWVFDETKNTYLVTTVDEWVKTNQLSIGDLADWKLYTSTGVSSNGQVITGTGSLESGAGLDTWVLDLREDQDGDGMEDSWERNVFGDLSKTGQVDTDIDGVVDFFEYIHGSDPLSNDVHNFITEFRFNRDQNIASASWVLKDGFVLGKDYFAEISGDLSNWEPLLPENYSYTTIEVIDAGKSKIELVVNLESMHAHFADRFFVRLAQP